MRRLGLLLLLAGPFIAGPALSSYFVFFESGLATNSTVNLTVDAAPQAPSEGSASVFTYRVGQLEAQQNQAPSRDELTSTQQQAENLRGQLGQATEQLKASPDRVGQLEAQLKQAPSRDELTSTQQQPDELLAQAMEQLKESQERFAHAMEQVNAWRELLAQAMEQLKASQDELTSTQQQADELRGQLGQATEQLKASQDRVDRLEAQLRQAPSLTQQEAENISSVTSTTPSCEAVSCSFALSPRADPGAARR